MLILVKLKKIIDKNIYLALLSILLALIYGFAYRKVSLAQSMLSIGDLMPFFITYHDLLTSLLSAWTPYGLGAFSADLPGIFVLQTVMRILTLDNVVPAQIIYYLSLMPISSLMMYIFLNHFIRSDLAKFTISLAYGLNSVTIPQFMEGGAPLLTYHATLPIILLSLLNILNGNTWEKKLRYMIILSIALGWFNPQTIFFAFPLLFAIYLAESVSRRSISYAVRSLGLIVCSVGISFLLLLPAYIAPISWTLKYIASPQGTFGPYAVSGSFTEYVQRIVDFFSTHPYSTDNFLRFTYALGVFAFISLFIRSRRRAIYLQSLIFATALIMLFWRLSMSQLAISFYQAFAFLILFKDLVKIHYMLIELLLLMAAIALDEFHERLYFRKSLNISYSKRKSLNATYPTAKFSRIIHMFLSLTLITTILISFLTITTYDVNPPLKDPYRNVLNFIDGVDFSNMEVSRTIQEVSQWLFTHRKSGEFFRTLWLPQDPRFVRDLRVYDPHTFIASPELTRLVLEPLVYGWTDNIGNVLSSFNVKYVIVNLEMEGVPLWGEGAPRLRYWGFNYYPVGSPREFIKLLDIQKDLKLIVNGTNFLIYENMKFYPYIVTYTQIFLVSPLSYLNLTKSFKVYNYTGNMVSNPGFERGTESWMLPLEEKVSIDTANKVSGNLSLRMEILKEKKAVGQAISVEGNATYYVSGWMKIKNVKGAYVEVVFKDSSGKTIGISIIQSSISGTKDWWQFSKAIISPKNATTAILKLVGGTSYDGINPGVTWFDDIVFMNGYYPLDEPAKNWWYIGDPTTRGPLLANAPKLFSHLPGFDQSKHLLIFGDLIQSNEMFWKYLKFSNIVFLGDPIISNETEEVTRSAKSVSLLYEGEAALTPLNGYWKQVGGEEFSYEYASSLLGGGGTVKIFPALIDGYYKVYIRTGMAGKASIEIDGKIIAEFTGDDAHTLKWYSTPTLRLKNGYHELSISFVGESMTIDQILIFSTADENTTITDLFSSEQPEIYSRKLSETEYHISLNSNSSTFIVLGEAYHESWEAYIDGEKLEHLPTYALGWANGFYVNSIGRNSIVITFREQEVRNILITIWAITWILLIVGLAYTLRGSIKRLTNSIAHRDKLFKKGIMHIINA